VLRLRWPSEEPTFSVPREDVENGHRGKGPGAGEPAALLLQEAFVLHLAQHIFQPDAIAALEGKRLGDFALAGLIGIFGNESQDILSRGQMRIYNSATVTCRSAI